jgi:hypothetical protein
LELAATREEIGPISKTVTTMHCVGCPALKTEDWSFEEENDGIDRGTTARCGAANNMVIDSYWHQGKSTPSWCPALNPPKAAKSEITND